MKHRLHIIALRVAILVLSLPLAFTSGATWQLEDFRSRLWTRYQALTADEP